MEAQPQRLWLGLKNLQSPSVTLAATAICCNRLTFQQSCLRSLLVVRITLPKPMSSASPFNTGVYNQSSRCHGLVRFHCVVDMVGHPRNAVNVRQQLVTVPSVLHVSLVPTPFLSCSLGCHAPECVAGTFPHAVLFFFFLSVSANLVP